jgi:C1A family cysteine protease
MARHLRRVVVGLAIAFALVLVLVAALVAAPLTAASPAARLAATPSAAFDRALLDRPPRPGALLQDPVDVHASREALARLSRRDLPSSYDPAFDLRPLGRLSPVKDQDPYATCWAFAAFGALESSLLPDQLWDFSEDNLITRSGFGPFGGGVRQAYWSGGTDFMSVAYLVRWAGPVDDITDRYDTPTPPRVNLVLRHVQDVVFWPGRSSVLDNDALKALVMAYGAVSVGMAWRDEAYDPKWSAYYSTARADVDHGVCIVGWDDDFPADRFGAAAGRPPDDGAFIVRNSWGRSWGAGGYFYVSYYDQRFARDNCMAFARVDAPETYAHVYQWDKLGWVASLGLRGAKNPDTAWFANRFTAKGAEDLAAVGFYTPGTDCSYTVCAGSSLTTLRPCASGTLALPGYHTVDLDPGLPLRKDRSFVVAVRLTTPGADPIPVERRVGRYSTHASASPGQSYVSRGGTRWQDLTRTSTADRRSNVCLKAYTR